MDELIGGGWETIEIISLRFFMGNEVSVPGGFHPNLFFILYFIFFWLFWLFWLFLDDFWFGNIWKVLPLRRHPVDFLLEFDSEWKDVFNWPHRSFQFDHIRRLKRRRAPLSFLHNSSIDLPVSVFVSVSMQLVGGTGTRTKLEAIRNDFIGNETAPALWKDPTVISQWAIVFYWWAFVMKPFNTLISITTLPLFLLPKKREEPQKERKSGIFFPSCL